MNTQTVTALCDSFRTERLARIAAPRRCCECKTKQAKPTSLYCSDRCKQSFYAELRGER